jgi:hypothetical protein
MSRRPTNPELAQLLRERNLAMADLACLARCSRQALHFYSTAARSRRSRIEPRIAAALGLSVPQLRRRLFLTKGKS